MSQVYRPGTGSYFRPQPVHCRYLTFSMSASGQAGPVIELPDQTVQLRRHAMQPATLRTASSTRFEDALNQGNIIEELIDHMVVSPSIWQGTGHFRIVPNSCQVESAIWQAACADQGPDDKREYRPSDHKPVSVTVEWD